MDSELLSLQTRYANINKAETHFEASRVRTLKDLSVTEKLEICPCCKLPYNAPLLDLKGRLEELGELGIGFPLFFYYMKYIGLFILMIALVAGIPCLIANVIENRQGQWGSGSSSWYLEGSSAAYGDTDSLAWWQGVLHSLAVIGIIVIHENFKARIANFARDTDFFNVSPSDFTVWVKNLNKNFDAEKLKQFLINSAELGLESVHSINIVHDVAEYVKKTNELGRLETEVVRTKDYELLYGQLPSKGCFSCRKTDLTQMEKSLIGLRRHVEELKSKIGESKTVGQVFVTFNKQTEASSVEGAFTITNLKRAMYKIFFCCYASTGYFEDHPIKVVRAPEPTDIIWENLQVGFAGRMRAKMWTWLVTGVMIGLNLLVLFYLKGAQIQIYDDYQNISSSDRDEQDLIRVQSLSIMISVAIIFVNRMIVVTVRKLSLREHLHTWTEYNISVCHKLVIAMTLNSAGLLIIVNKGVETSDWYEPSGLINDVSTLLVTMGISAFLVPFLSPMYAMKLLQMSDARKKAAKGRLLLSQIEANLLWQGPEFDLSDCYASNLKFLAIALIFAPIFPFGLIICLASQIFQYWIFKYLLLRRCQRPRLIGGDLSHQAVRWIPVISLMYAVSTLYITNRIADGQYRIVAPVVALLVVVFYFVVPFKYCKRQQQYNTLLELLTEEENSYSANVKDFFVDYDRANPFTSKKAWENWQKLIQGYQRKPSDYLKHAAYFRLSEEHASPFYRNSLISVESGENRP